MSADLHDLYTVTCEELPHPEPLAYYDGALGYEAYVCRKCGTYFDHYGQQKPDDWSLRFIGKHRRK
jgi:hypothetical protein